MRRARSLAPWLLLALAVTGCDEVADSDEPSVKDGPVHYVALGDSFTSGPFIGEMRADAPGCGRSTVNYPSLLEEWLEAESFTDVSCAGARTDNLANPQGTFGGGMAPPQLDAVSEETTLVTLGIGANNSLIYSGLVACHAATTVCLSDALLASAREVEPAITASVEQVRAKAPDAQIVVIGYPQILPTEQGCEMVTASPEVLGQVREVEEALNASLENGAEAAGATYVDLWGPSQGHDACAGEEAWIVDRPNAAGTGAQFHPNAAGMRATAGVIHEVLTGEPPPDQE